VLALMWREELYILDKSQHQLRAKFWAKPTNPNFKASTRRLVAQ